MTACPPALRLPPSPSPIPSTFLLPWFVPQPHAHPCPSRRSVPVFFFHVLLFTFTMRKPVLTIGLIPRKIRLLPVPRTFPKLVPPLDDAASSLGHSGFGFLYINGEFLMFLLFLPPPKPPFSTKANRHTYALRQQNFFLPISPPTFEPTSPPSPLYSISSSFSCPPKPHFPRVIFSYQLLPFLWREVIITDKDTVSPPSLVALTVVSIQASWGTKRAQAVDAISFNPPFFWKRGGTLSSFVHF